AGWEVKADSAVRKVLLRPGEDFPVGEVFAAGAVDPGAALDAQPQVGAPGSQQPQFAPGPQQGYKPGRALGPGAPGGGGVVVVQQARPEDEVLVVGQGHAGVLGGGVARQLGHDPAQGLGGGAAQEQVHERPACLVACRLPGRINAGQCARV